MSSGSPGRGRLAKCMATQLLDAIPTSRRLPLGVNSALRDHLFEFLSGLLGVTVGELPDEIELQDHIKDTI